MSGAGLVITENHERIINSFETVPLSFKVSESIPEKWIPPLIVESQGSSSSCVGHAESLACSHANYVATGEVIRFSRRFAYITAQTASGQFLGSDNGTSIESALRAAADFGCCREETCPFQERYDANLPQKAYEEARLHKHHGDVAYDCRDWDTAISWLTDRRCIIIGTKWMSGQASCTGIEDKRCGTSGGFYGYHSRSLIAFDTVGGEIVPVCQNSHGQQWADGGRSKVMHDLWDVWRKDGNFFALGFNRIDEITPQRSTWSESRSGDSC